MTIALVLKDHEQGRRCRATKQAITVSRRCDGYDHEKKRTEYSPDTKRAAKSREDYSKQTEALKMKKNASWFINEEACVEEREPVNLEESFYIHYPSIVPTSSFRISLRLQDRNASGLPRLFVLGDTHACVVVN